MALLEFRDSLLAEINASIDNNRTPVESKIALLAAVQQALAVGGGGGGGSVTLTDTEYFYWRVKEADTTLALVVGDLVREAIVSGASTWRKVGASSNLASAPPLSKIELAGGSSSGAIVQNPTGCDNIPYPAGDLGTVKVIPLLAARKVLVIQNRTDKDLFVNYRAADPSSSDNDEALPPGGRITLNKLSGHYFGEIRLLGDNPTSGRVVVLSQT
jgi:hypothetical protein